jgi:hypothetical protein
MDDAGVNGIDEPVLHLGQPPVECEDAKLNNGL